MHSFQSSRNDRKNTDWILPLLWNPHLQPSPITLRVEWAFLPVTHIPHTPCLRSPHSMGPFAQSATQSSLGLSSVVQLSLSPSLKSRRSLPQNSFFVLFYNLVTICTWFSSWWLASLLVFVFLLDFRGLPQMSGEFRLFIFKNKSLTISHWKESGFLGGRSDTANV